MNTRRLVGQLAVGVAALSCAGGALAHPGHDHERGHRHAQDETVVLAAQETAAAPAGTVAEAVSGQGALKFRVFAVSDRLPAEAVKVLKDAHGGFAVDRRNGHGEIYFGLPGAGIIKLSGDLKTATLLDTTPEVRDTNLHNAMIWYAKDGEPFLTFPANAANKVFTTTLDGKLVHTLTPPLEFKFADQPINDYFANAENKFVPTDVEQLGGLYYIPTGYSSLDYVLTAKVTSTNPFAAEWNSLAFGGKGDGPGQFGTGHGITVSPDRSVLNVSDRPKSQIDRFSPEGKYLETVELPAGSLPCDIAFESDLVVVGCLEGPDKDKGAPIYILEDDKVVSTIMPKEELGLTQFDHIHNATMVTVNETLYVVAQAWNPGDFAILEQVK